MIENIPLNNILVQRGLVVNEKKRDDREMVRTGKDEADVVTSAGVQKNENKRVSLRRR